MKIKQLQKIDKYEQKLTTKNQCFIQNQELEQLQIQQKSNDLILSKNLLLTIFSYLNQKELALCEFVCRRWNNFINSKNIILEKLFIYVNTYQDNDYYKFYISNTTLNYIEWVNKHLKFYNLKAFEFIQVFDSQLTPSNTKKLYSLLFQIFNCISNMSNLKKLSITMKSFGFMSEMNLKYLTKLEFEEYKDNQFHLFLYAIQQNYQTLETLQLVSHEIGIDFPDKIFQALNVNMIKKIKLWGIILNEDIIDKIIQFKNLIRQLSLKSSSFSMSLQDNKEDNSIYLTKKLLLAIGQQLTKIMLHSVDDSTIISISQCCPNLKKVSFITSMINNYPIYQLLTRCNQIEYLLLKNIWGINFKCIPIQNQSLKQLIIPEERINEVEIQYLESKMKQLKITCLK